jgi:starch synthase
LKVAFATPELQSLVRRTGLAEFAENLPRTLMQQGLEVLVFVPWTIDVEDVRVLGLREVATLRVKDGETSTQVKLHRGHVRDLPVVLIDHPLFRDRHPYGDERGPYGDNWRRYALFTRAVLEGTVALGFLPDVIHGFDWTAGLLPLIKQLETGKGHPLDKTATYFGIHNLAMQGNFEREVLPKIGIPLQYFRFTEGIELAARVNFLKAGAEFATLVGASSPTMAQRLKQLNRGDGLEDTFQRREDELIGIRGGIDYRAWDPSTDQLLAQTYSAAQADPTTGKRKCKSTLQDALKLENNPKKPLIAIISRFDTDGGFDVLAEALTPMLEREISLVMMGPGAPEILDRIRTLEQTFAGNCKLIEGYNVNTAHTILGGADALLLPGHYHASTSLCAIALRYGVTPVAYAQSGLEDLITDLTEQPETGTGFLFESYTPDSLVQGVDAMRVFYKKVTEWRAAVKRCMELDFSWQECGREYDKAYKRAVRLATGQEKRKRRKPKRNVVTAPEPEPPRPKRIHPNLPSSFEGVDEEDAGQIALVRRLTPGGASDERPEKEERGKHSKDGKESKGSDKVKARSDDSKGGAAKKTETKGEAKPTKVTESKSPADGKKGDAKLTHEVKKVDGKAAEPKKGNGKPGAEVKKSEVKPAAESRKAEAKPAAEPKKASPKKAEPKKAAAKAEAAPKKADAKSDSKVASKKSKDGEPTSKTAAKKPTKKK